MRSIKATMYFVEYFVEQINAASVVQVVQLGDGKSLDSGPIHFLQNRVYAIQTGTAEID
jgi:hypothetical protein